MSYFFRIKSSFFIFLRVIKNSIIKWPVAVKNEIPSLNGRVIIQSQVAAWSDLIIWGRLFFGAHLCLYVSVSDFIAF